MIQAESVQLLDVPFRHAMVTKQAKVWVGLKEISDLVAYASKMLGESLVLLISPSNRNDTRSPTFSLCILGIAASLRVINLAGH